MRTTAGSALVLLIAGALAAPAPAATRDAPGSVAPGEQVAIVASGLTAGIRYAVFLARDGFAGLPCLGRLARRTAREGEPTVHSGALPTTCAAGPASVNGLHRARGRTAAAVGRARANVGEPRLCPLPSDVRVEAVT